MSARTMLVAVIGAAAAMAVPTSAWAQSEKQAATQAVPPAAASPAKVGTNKARDRATTNTAATSTAGTNKPAKPITRREEIEHAIDTRTVPERYRSSVPKEYQKYSPFAKDR